MVTVRDSVPFRTLILTLRGNAHNGHATHLMNTIVTPQPLLDVTVGMGTGSLSRARVRARFRARDRIRSTNPTTGAGAA